MKYSIIVSAYNQLEQFKKIMPAWEAQTVKDFEFIVADDGSSDGLKEWLRSAKYNVKFSTIPDDGYQYFKAMRKACELAEGDYLIFASGDSYPAPDFLEEMGRALKPDRVVCGMRTNIDWETGEVIEKDWRFKQQVPFLQQLLHWKVEIFPVMEYPYPWVMMTSTGMGISRELYKKIGGFTPVYDRGYGKGDWSIAMKAYFLGATLWYNTAATLFHKFDANPKPDTKESENSFVQELSEWRTKHG